MGRDLIFKGATRPPMMMGIPIVPFILLAITHLILAMWLMMLVSPLAAIAMLLLLLFEVLVLRQVTADDNHRLNQYLLRIRSMGFRRTSSYWGAQSMAPTQYKKRDWQDYEA